MGMHSSINQHHIASNQKQEIFKFSYKTRFCRERHDSLLTATTPKQTPVMMKVYTFFKSYSFLVLYHDATQKM